MSQMNFFITREEMMSGVNQLILSEDYTLFDRTCLDSQTPNPINELNIDSVQKITIWINNPKRAPICSLKGEGPINGKFLFDIYKDPIIELDIGKEENKLFSPSRLFYKTGWIEDKELRELHSKLASKVGRRFKKLFTTTTLLRPFYISDSVLKYLAYDYELELGQGGLRVNKHNINGT